MSIGRRSRPLSCHCHGCRHQRRNVNKRDYVNTTRLTHAFFVLENKQIQATSIDFGLYRKVITTNYHISLLDRPSLKEATRLRKGGSGQWRQRLTAKLEAQPHMLLRIRHMLDYEKEAKGVAGLAAAAHGHVLVKKL